MRTLQLPRTLERELVKRICRHKQLLPTQASIALITDSRSQIVYNRRRTYTSVVQQVSQTVFKSSS